jgi:hypothetical protein
VKAEQPSPKPAGGFFSMLKDAFMRSATKAAEPSPPRAAAAPAAIGAANQAVEADQAQLIAAPTPDVDASSSKDSQGEAEAPLVADKSAAPRSRAVDASASQAAAETSAAEASAASEGDGDAQAEKTRQQYDKSCWVFARIMRAVAVGCDGGSNAEFTRKAVRSLYRVATARKNYKVHSLLRKTEHEGDQAAVDACCVMEALVNVNTLPGKEVPVLSFPEMQQLSVLQVRCSSALFDVCCLLAARGHSQFFQSS